MFATSSRLCIVIGMAHTTHTPKHPLITAAQASFISTAMHRHGAVTVEYREQFGSGPVISVLAGGWESIVAPGGSVWAEEKVGS